MISARLPWIHILRGIAITAMVVDHALYLSYGLRFGYLQAYLGFSVPWFVFLMGVTSAISGRLPGYTPVRYLKKRSVFALWYVIGSFVAYQVRTPWADRSLMVFWNSLVDFSALPPYYFFLHPISSYVVFPSAASGVDPMEKSGHGIRIHCRCRNIVFCRRS